MDGERRVGAIRGRMAAALVLGGIAGLAFLAPQVAWAQADVQNVEINGEPVSLDGAARVTLFAEDFPTGAVTVTGEVAPHDGRILVRLEVSRDGGENWQAATLTRVPDAPDRFSIEFEPGASGAFDLDFRAITLPASMFHLIVPNPGNPTPMWLRGAWLTATEGPQDHKVALASANGANVFQHFDAMQVDDPIEYRLEVLLGIEIHMHGETVGRRAIVQAGNNRGGVLQFEEYYVNSYYVDEHGADVFFDFNFDDRPPSEATITLEVYNLANGSVYNSITFSIRYQVVEVSATATLEMQVEGEWIEVQPVGGGIYGIPAGTQVRTRVATENLGGGDLTNARVVGTFNDEAFTPVNTSVPGQSPYLQFEVQEVAQNVMQRIELQIRGSYDVPLGPNKTEEQTGEVLPEPITFIISTTLLPPPEQVTLAGFALTTEWDENDSVQAATLTQGTIQLHPNHPIDFTLGQSVLWQISPTGAVTKGTLTLAPPEPYSIPVGAAALMLSNVYLDATGPVRQFDGYLNLDGFLAANGSGHFAFEDLAIDPAWETVTHTWPDVQWTMTLGGAEVTGTGTLVLDFAADPPVRLTSVSAQVPAALIPFSSGGPWAFTATELVLGPNGWTGALAADNLAIPLTLGGNLFPVTLVGARLPLEDPTHPQATHLSVAFSNAVRTAINGQASYDVDLSGSPAAMDATAGIDVQNAAFAFQALDFTLEGLQITSSGPYTLDLSKTQSPPGAPADWVGVFAGSITAHAGQAQQSGEELRFGSDGVRGMIQFLADGVQNMHGFQVGTSTMRFQVQVPDNPPVVALEGTAYIELPSPIQVQGASPRLDLPTLLGMIEHPIIPIDFPLNFDFNYLGITALQGVVVDLEDEAGWNPAGSSLAADFTGIWFPGTVTLKLPAFLGFDNPIPLTNVAIGSDGFYMQAPLNNYRLPIPGLDAVRVFINGTLDIQQSRLQEFTFTGTIELNPPAVSQQKTIQFTNGTLQQDMAGTLHWHIALTGINEAVALIAGTPAPLGLNVGGIVIDQSGLWSTAGQAGAWKGVVFTSGSVHFNVLSNGITLGFTNLALGPGGVSGVFSITLDNPLANINLPGPIVLSPQGGSITVTNNRITDFDLLGVGGLPFGSSSTDFTFEHLAIDLDNNGVPRGLMVGSIDIGPNHPMHFGPMTLTCTGLGLDFSQFRSLPGHAKSASWTGVLFRQGTIEFDLPFSNDPITFGFQNAAVSPSGGLSGTFFLSGQVQFELASLFTIQLTNGALTVNNSAITKIVLGGSIALPPAVKAHGGGRVEIQFQGLQIDPQDGDIYMTGLSLPNLDVACFIVSATNVTVDLSGDQSPQGKPANWMGVGIGQGFLQFPDGMSLPGSSQPLKVAVQNLQIGSDGISGSVNITQGLPKLGLAGFSAQLTKLQVTLEANELVGADIEGSLKVPFFDATLVIEVVIDNDGLKSIAIGVPGAPLELGGAGVTVQFWLEGIELDIQESALTIDGGIGFVISSLDFDLPRIDFQGLRIGADGTFAISQIDLTLQLKVDIYGFGLEITKLSFGAADNIFFGISGKLNLVNVIQASVSNLRIYIDPADWSFEGMTVDSISASFKAKIAEGSLTLEFFNNNTDGKGFRGEAHLTLAFGGGFNIEGFALVGNLNGTSYWRFWANVEFPGGIPLGATGLAIQGFNGGLGYNVAYNFEAGTWAFQGGAGYSLSAGVTIGSLPDNGWTFRVRVTLTISTGGVFTLEGVGTVLGGSVQFSVVIQYNHPQRTFHAVLTLSFNLIGIISGTGQATIHFAPSDWYINIGGSATILEILSASAYSHVGANGMGVEWSCSFEIDLDVVWFEFSSGGSIQVQFDPARCVADYHIQVTIGVLGIEFGIKFVVHAEAPNPTIIRFQCTFSFFGSWTVTVEYNEGDWDAWVD